MVKIKNIIIVSEIVVITFLNKIDINIAKKLILKAKEAGANAVKFQKRTISRILTKEGLMMPYENRNSFGKTYGGVRIPFFLLKSSLKNVVSSSPYFIS